MVKARNRIANLISSAGSGLFKAISRLEERGNLKGTFRFLKLAILGGLITLIGVISAQEQDEIIMCYEIAIVPDVYITEIEVDPNPTNGADSITVRAKAQVRDSLAIENIVTEAYCETYVDSTTMTALDGEFDEPTEYIEGRLSVESADTGITWVWIAATASMGVEGDFAPATQSFKLLVTEAVDTIEGADTTKAADTTKIKEQ